MNILNILFINTSRIWGGNEKWTHLAAHELAKKHNVSLAYRSRSLGKRFSVNRHRLPFLNRLDIYSMYMLIKLVKDQEIDVLVSTNRKYYLMGAMAAMLAGCRHFVRCGIVWKVPDNIYCRFLFQNIDGVIVNARAVRDELSRSAPVQADRVHLIYNGLDIHKLDKIDSTPQDKPYPFTIIASGELIHRKRYDFLIRAFARFLKAKPVFNAGILLMGKGKQQNELKLLTKKLGLEKHVTFTGFLDNPYSLMRLGDIFVSVSQNEGISNSMLEAMYLGLPVITTPAGGAEEIISHGKNGFLIDHGDENALAEFFWQLCKDKKHLLNKVGQAGSRTVMSRFSLHSMALAMEKAFDSTLRKK